MISVSPRSSTFVDLLGPPMEKRRRANTIELALERGAPSELGVFEILDGSEMLIDERRIGQWPEMFGGLEFR